MFSVLAALVACAQPVHAQTAWSTAQAENLYRWMERAESEGIDLPKAQGQHLRSAIDAGDLDLLEPIANEAALTVLRAWRGRCCGSTKPSWWHIDGSLTDAQLRAGLTAALEADQLDLYLRSIRPSHTHYSKLVEALTEETDPDRRKVMLANLARWRWLPARLGKRYLLVNIAAQELTLWEQGSLEGRWRVIVGKPVTRTPVFTTQVRGVVLNPWWEIPSSIAREGIASFVRRNPAAARARGYVFQNGRYRQMPGDNNALGRMKLVMPNPYSVYLHDTSSRDLFREDPRYFSHGCIRVDRALEFVGTLFANDGWDLARVDEEVATGRTQTFALSESLPLYVTYFTAEPDASASVRFLEDVYDRDPVTIAHPSTSDPTEVYGSPSLLVSSTFGEVAGDLTCRN
ncbi:MAG: L,D-transpeptidase family protein [Erythrobacter sp.]|nr:L,D-transpeptidase family protein [Erythrobacter sp.]